MKSLDLSVVQEAGVRLPAGGYVCKIVNVLDFPDKEYLRICYDIAEGSYTGYLDQLSQQLSFWPGDFIRSYKARALYFFKSFLDLVKQSNETFPYDGHNFSDEKILLNMYVGLVLGHEEYIATTDQTTRTRLYVANIQTVQSIRENKFKIPELKTLAIPNDSAHVGQSDFSSQDSEDGLPF